MKSCFLAKSSGSFVTRWDAEAKRAEVVAGHLHEFPMEDQ
jgi:hypothetical protein